MRFPRIDAKVPLFLAVLLVAFSFSATFSAIPWGANASSPSTSAGNSNVHTSRQLSPSLSIASSGMQVNPFSNYGSEPAPVGVADYGIGAGNLPYEYNTTSFLGTITANSLDTVNSTGSTDMTFQFNVNLAFTNAGITFAYWVQNVVFVNSSTGQVFFIDNVWNMSSANASIYNSTLYGSGNISSVNGINFYYAVANLSLPGSNAVLSYPSTVQLMINSTITPSGVPKVTMLYNDGFGWATYDNIYFPFAGGSFSDQGFVVDGFTPEPNGQTFYDSELIMGGPGGGDTTTDVLSNVSLGIQYWNGHNYQEIPNAYNFGSNTGERISNAASGAYYYSENGSLFERVVNGAGILQQVYTTSSISFLNISSSLQRGTLYVNGTAYPFVGGDVNVTIGPGTYDVTIYNATTLYKSFIVSLKPGQYLPIQLDSYLVTFTEEGLPSGTAWWVNMTAHAYSSKGDTISFYVTNGTYQYTVSTYDKNYAGNITSGSFVVDGQPVSQTVNYTSVLFNITIAEKGLPADASWSILMGGNTSSTLLHSMSLVEMNGTYAVSVLNTTSYYTNNYSLLVTIKGKNITEQVIFMHYAYISGAIVPGVANLRINGNVFNVSTGKFNFSVVAGNYSITVTSSGYISYSTNVTLSPGQVKLMDVSLVSNVPRVHSLLDYVIYGSVVLAFTAGGLMAYSRSRRR